MSALHSDMFASPSIRCSLKRGLARQAVTQAAATEADIPAVLAQLRDLRPNRKSLSRVVLRLRGMRGIIGAGIVAEGAGLAIVLRSLRSIVTRAEACDLFAETALIYTRLRVRVQRGHVYCDLARASFCLHALERLVERSSVPLSAPLLPVIDAEGVALLRSFVAGDLHEDNGDNFVSAREAGVWAGSTDHTEVEDGWGLVCTTPGMPVPIYSARTFLSPDEMRPTLWLKWRKDRALTVARRTGN